MTNIGWIMRNSINLDHWDEIEWNDEGMMNKLGLWEIHLYIISTSYQKIVKLVQLKCVKICNYLFFRILFYLFCLLLLFILFYLFICSNLFWILKNFQTLINQQGIQLSQIILKLSKHLAKRRKKLTYWIFSSSGPKFIVKNCWYSSYFQGKLQYLGIENLYFVFISQNSRYFSFRSSLIF